MSTPTKKKIWFVTNGTAKYFFAASNIRAAETKGREHGNNSGWKTVQLWECTGKDKEVCRNEDLPLVEGVRKVSRLKRDPSETDQGYASRIR
jgi:hypothetical protein